MTDLVVASLEAWDGVWRRNQYLLAGLLRRDPTLRLLFVEPAADPLHALASRRPPRLGGGLRPLDLPGAEGRIWAYQPTKVLPRRIDRHADDRLAGQITRAARRVGFVDPRLWINDPSAVSVLRHTGWRALYDITDDWLLADRSPAEHERLVWDEAELMRRCAEVVVCSPNLVATKSRIRPVTLIPNAVDVAAYRVPTSRPTDLPDGPVALYLGTIHRDRIDVQLCAATARKIQGRGRLVLVGPAPLSAADTALLTRAGVLLLGPKERSEVPGYLQWADTLVVPHVVTPFTESLDPIKLYEYQAVGRAVVSTPVAGFRDTDDDRVTVADAARFPGEVASSLPARWRFPQRTDRRVPSWHDRVEEMAEVVGRLGPHQKDGA